MHPRPDGRLFTRIERTIYHRGVTEIRTTYSSYSVAIAIAPRIDGLVQRREPTIPLFVADRRNNQQISSAGGRDVRHTDSLGPLAQAFLCLVIAQFPGSASEQTRPAHVTLGAAIPLRIPPPKLAVHAPPNHNPKSHP